MLLCCCRGWSLALSGDGRSEEVALRLLCLGCRGLSLTGCGDSDGDGDGEEETDGERCRCSLRWKGRRGRG